MTAMISVLSLEHDIMAFNIYQPNCPITQHGDTEGKSSGLKMPRSLR